MMSIMGDGMSETATAKLFMHGRSQAVRLPKEFRLPGTEVRVRKVGSGVMLEPIVKRTREEIRAMFAEIDRLAEKHGPFMPDGREQPPMPPDDNVPSFD